MDTAERRLRSPRQLLHCFHPDRGDQSPGTIASIDQSGAVILQKFNFSGNAPTRATLDATLDAGPSKPPAQVDTKVLYQWVNNNSAINPVIVIDTNLRSYPDPTTGAVQLDPTIDATSGLGPIYVAWSTDDTQTR